MAYIDKISTYFPAQRRTNAEISTKFPEWPVEKIANKTGIHERRISAEGELSSDMAIAVGERFFEEHEVMREEIDFLLICSQSPDYYFPSTACLVQHALGLRREIGGFDYTLGCSGYLYGLAMANSFIDSGLAKNVLLITSETITKFINEKDKGNLTLFGDAATATFLRADGGVCRPSNFSLGTDGGGAQNIIMHRGGMRQPGFKEGVVNEDRYGNVFDKNYLYMDGPEVFTFTLNTVPGMVKRVLAEAGLDKEDVDLFVFHQANGYMLEQLRKFIRIPKERFYFCLKKSGNTVASTIPIALKQAHAEGRLMKGSKVMLAAFGTGYSWGGCVLTYEGGL
ncbi:MAG: 3-oxoacyl-ACP synthase [Bacteroidetes bacterium]|jgi:3-oxoacyl-[acyl-carrier-protein] synthase-3|nr:MAG: 3-oxoacyl-ACP synthase [Bacteroidota bacterium]